MRREHERDREHPADDHRADHVGDPPGQLSFGRSGPGSITRAQNSRPVKKNIACSSWWTQPERASRRRAPGRARATSVAVEQRATRAHGRASARSGAASGERASRAADARPRCRAAARATSAATGGRAGSAAARRSAAARAGACGPRTACRRRPSSGESSARTIVASPPRTTPCAVALVGAASARAPRPPSQYSSPAATHVDQRRLDRPAAPRLIVTPRRGSRTPARRSRRRTSRRTSTPRCAGGHVRRVPPHAAVPPAAPRQSVATCVSIQ